MSLYSKLQNKICNLKTTIHVLKTIFGSDTELTVGKTTEIWLNKTNSFSDDNLSFNQSKTIIQLSIHSGFTKYFKNVDTKYIKSILDG